MTAYHYAALDTQGKKRKGELSALNKTEAVRQLKEQGLFPVRLQEVSQNRLRIWISKMNWSQINTSSKQITGFTRQLSILLGAGIPLVDALRILHQQENRIFLRKVIASISQSVEAGRSFSQSLEQHPDIFSPLYISMTRAGEAIGSLSIVLARLTLFLERRQKLQSKILAAMAYPTVVVCVTIGILIFLLMFIVPRFKQIFVDILSNKPLPLLTRAVIQTSDLFIQLSWPIPYTLFLASGCIMAYQFVKKLKPIAQAIDRLYLRLPLIRGLIIKIAVAHIASTLSILLVNGVPMLSALKITQETASNKIFAAALKRVHNLVQGGESLSAPFQASQLFPPMVVSMVRVGEETGQLSLMLSKVAEVYEEEVERLIQALTALIEPMMIVILALVVGTVVIAIFSPILMIINDLSLK